LIPFLNSLLVDSDSISTAPATTAIGVDAYAVRIFDALEHGAVGLQSLIGWGRERILWDGFG